MNKKIILCLAALTAGGAAFAQTAPAGTTNTATLPTFGTWELTLNGSGSANKDLDSGLGGINVSLGRYVSEHWAWAVRQSINYSNPDVGDTAWIGSTALALDRHFGNSDLRPFLGVNGGYIYGESVDNTWSAGIETGAKYYVSQNAFVQLMVDYGWLFDDGDDLEDEFDDGRWSWNVGVGFNF